MHAFCQFMVLRCVSSHPHEPRQCNNVQNNVDWADMPGESFKVMTAEWTSDQQEVVLEVPDEKGKGTQDSSRSSWQQLFLEMENAGVIDVGVSGHDIFAPVGGASEQGGGPTLKAKHSMAFDVDPCITASLPKSHALPGPQQHYVFKPKATTNYFQYSEVTSNHKYSTCASIFNAAATCPMKL